MSRPAVSFGEFLRVWLRVAALSFGGPAGQIAVMHRIVVEDEKKWVDERRFLHALNYCMLLPGPEAQQLATIPRWLIDSQYQVQFSWATLLLTLASAAGLFYLKRSAIEVLLAAILIGPGLYGLGAR